MAELNPSYSGANPADQFLLDTQKYDTDGVLILSSKRRQSKLETENPIPAETVVGGIWTFYEMEQISDKLVFLVTNTRDVSNAPAVKSSKYDENLGQIKITKQLIEAPSNTNSVLTPTTKTYYEARETGTGPSSVVCYKIVETYSDGTGADPNPAFPTKTENTVSPELGNVPVVKISQITTDTSSVGSLTYAGTIGTKITYTPFNQYLRLRVTETWNLFDQNSVEKKQSVIIPEKFKSASAVTETASLVSVSDIVSPIALGTGGKGVVESQSARADAKTIKNTTVTITDPVTPNLTEYSLDNAGQLVTIANNYIDASDAAPSPSALTPVVERQALGGGKAEQKVGTISQVFDQSSVEKKQSVVIPEKFKSNNATTETLSQIVASNATTNIPLGTGGKGVIESQSTRASAFTVKNTTVTITDPVTPSLTEYSLDNAGQLVTISNNYIDSSDAAPAPSALTPVIERQALGGGKADQKVGTIAQVFDQKSVEKKQSVIIPEKFKSANATTETSSEIVVGTTANPIVLGAGGKGIIESQSTRASAFTVKNTTVTITDPVTPSLTEYSLDNAGQLVTIASSYIDASDAAPAVTALTPVIERQALGGGKADQKIGTISQVFDQSSLEKKQSVVIPEKFKSATATTETFSQIVVGNSTINLPLGTGGKGVVESQSTRASAFTVKNTTVTVTDPVTPNLTEYSLDNAGQLVTISNNYIDASDAAPSPSALTPVIERQSIGGGKADQKIGTISQVFDQKSIEKKQSVIIPDKFKSATATTETLSEIVVGTTANPTTLGTGGTGVVDSQSTRASAFTVKNTTVTVTAAPTTATEYSLDNAGQLVTISNNYIDASDAAPAPSALTPVIERQSLGGGKADQKIGTISQVFDQKSIERKQSVVIPDKFKSANATTETSSEIIVGIAANPTALGTGGTGVVDSQSTRASAFTVKNTTVTVTDTAQNLTEYSLDNAGQLVTIASSYINASDAAPAVTALTPVIERQSLGGGKAEQKIGSVAQVFDRNTTRKEYPQVIPQKFLANAIVTESSSVYAGTSPSVAAPSQVTGTIKVESQRIDSTKVQDSITSRTLSLPVNVAGSMRTEHGIATVTESLVTATQTADPSYLVLSDKVDGLNNGTQTREKVVIDSFPVLSGQLFDKQNDAAIRYTEQIQSAPPLGQTRTEIVPEDFSRSRVRVFDEASIDSAFSDVTTILGLTKVNLPPELISATVIYTGASGSSVSSSSDPTYNKYTPVGTSSNGSLSKSASLGGSIQVHTDLTYVIKEYSSTEVVCTHYFFYVKSGATMGQILTKCGGASQMPLFFPNSFQLVLSGMGVNYSLSANTQLQVGVSADGGSSDSATKTSGYSLSNEYITQVTSIPSCIRPSTAISVIGNPVLTTGLMVAGANTPAISYGGSTDAPVVTNSVSTTATATATITPSVIPATSGTTAIPKSGNYLVELTGNISEYGYNLMHGVVVNFSQYA